MTEKELKEIKVLVSDSIGTFVNGKIDNLSRKLDENHEKHREDMTRILPVIEAYETAQTSGRLAMKIGGAVTVLGGAWIIVKQIFPNL